MAEHHFDVIEESIDAIMPRNNADFSHSDDQGGESSGISVNQLQDVHATVSAHNKSK